MPINHFMFHPATKSLDLGSVYNYPLDKTSLPRSLAKLRLSDIYSHPISCDIFPETLVELDLGARYNRKMNKNSLPRLLIKLALSDQYTHQIYSDIFPETVECLCIGNNFSHCLGDANAPKFLTKLKLNMHVRFERCYFLKELEYIELADGESRSDVLDILPQTLTELHLGKEFNQKLCQQSLPKSLTKLHLSENYNHAIDDFSIPDCLEYLSLGKNFDSCIVFDCLPSNLSFVELSSSDQLYLFHDSHEKLYFSIICSFDLVDQIPLAYSVLYDSNKIFHKSWKKIGSETVGHNTYSRLVNMSNYQGYRLLAKSAKN